MRELYVTASDLQRLEDILDSLPESEWNKSENLNRLVEDLEHARVVSSETVPSDVVTMNSNVQLRDLDTGEEMTVIPVFPSDADLSQCKISILAPIGSALIGYRAGDTVEWAVPSGMRRLRIERILYQPEAAGRYDK